jgi:hypothetical protein
MKSYYVLTFAIAIVIVISGFRFEPVSDDKIQYPKGYRDWTHVKTYIVLPKNPAFRLIGGFNHVYANDLALQGYKTGRFPDGSVIVSDVVQANADSLNVREGNRHHIDVMVRDSIKFAAAGGWGFESFSGDSKDQRMVTPDISARCTNCHKKQDDYVFSEFRK